MRFQMIALSLLGVVALAMALDCTQNSDCTDPAMPVCSNVTFTCVECNVDDDCTFVAGSTAACANSVCEYTRLPPPDCVHNRLWWYHNSALATEFLPLAIGMNTLTISTQQELEDALLGWGTLNPIKQLAGALAAAKLNVLNGAIPGTDASIAIDQGEAIATDCLADPIDSWVEVLAETKTCGTLGTIGIAGVSVKLTLFNNGMLATLPCHRLA